MVTRFNSKLQTKLVALAVALGCVHASNLHEPTVQHYFMLLPYYTGHPGDNHANSSDAISPQSQKVLNTNDNPFDFMLYLRSFSFLQPKNSHYTRCTKRCVTENHVIGTPCLRT
ncbi:hypothetical protein LZ31DRAFT_341539 [Colletotrichum somersetense]|nr:hypothetical protein LZ31DRAFT_341539 [Colletotrichum somersetense]